MKRLFFFIGLLGLLHSVQAQERVYVTCADQSVQSYEIATFNDLTFSADGTLLYLNVKEGITVCYAVAQITSMEFAQPSGSSPASYTEAVSVAVDSSDDSSYTEVAETVVTDETNDEAGDFIENFASSNTITITYNGASVTATPTVSGVTVMKSGADVTVYSAKKKVQYLLKGTTADGSFKLYSDYKCQLTLAGVNLTNPTGAAINIQSGKTMLVLLADGTTNSLTDGATYTMATGEDQKGTFFSEGQLVFSGKGALTVKSNYGHGIVSDDYIRVRSGNITINSAKDGFNTNDKFLMYGGVVTITAADDGVDVGKGFISLNGGKLIVNAVDDGLVASYEGASDGTVDPLILPDVTINGGLVKVVTTGDKGMGVKAIRNLSMTGGVLQATSRGDGSKAITCDGNMAFSGGKVTALTEGEPFEENADLSSAAAIRSKGSLTIDGAVLALKSTGAGAKGINNVGTITLKSGRVTVVSNGAKYTSAVGSSRSRGVVSDGSISLYGGTLRIASTDDALYAGANLLMTGGVVHAFSTSAQAAVYTGNFAFTGGWLVTQSVH